MLATYLNDHLAGATVGIELARRSANSNRGTRYGRPLTKLADEIAEDRRSLVEIMRALGVRVDPVKVLGAWGAEKVGRLKLNGRLVGYSPLSRVVEIEALALGVRGKMALWQALQRLELDGLDGPTVKALEARAERQLKVLEQNRLRAVDEALGRGV